MAIAVAVTIGVSCLATMLMGFDEKLISKK